MCASCLAKVSPGRDATCKWAHYTLAAQVEKMKAMYLDATEQQENARDAEHYERCHADAADSLRQAANNRARAAQVALGEVVPEQPSYLKDTLSLPDFAALDASTERTRLLMANGVDAMALALDAVHSAGARSSLEKMHLHQLAVLHKTALEQINSANYTSNHDLQTKHLQIGNRLIRTFQQGLMALVRLRGGGMPVIQHVHIHDGGQAVVGTMQNGKGYG
jgi:hypothetical protein